MRVLANWKSLGLRIHAGTCCFLWARGGGLVLRLRGRGLLVLGRLFLRRIHVQNAGVHVGVDPIHERFIEAEHDVVGEVPPKIGAVCR